MATSPYAAADDEMLAEIIQQAEARLEAQLTSALGADQRAMTFAGLLLAAVGALLGFAFGSSSATPLVSPIVAVAAGLTLASGLAAWSAQPTQWEYVGNVPSGWLGDIEAAKPLHDGRAEMAGYYDEMIATNEAAIGRAAFLMRVSMLTSLATLGIGIAGVIVAN